MKPNDGAPYRALEVAVATSDFIAAPRRISLASFHSVGSSRTPEEVWIEGHVSVKWLISRVTITATSRLDKPSKVPVDVRDPERVSFPATTRTRISSDRHVTFSPFHRTATVAAISRYTHLKMPRLSPIAARARSWASARSSRERCLSLARFCRGSTREKNED